jgi:peptidoglycan hydrolase CwlO-like protein
VSSSSTAEKEVVGGHESFTSTMSSSAREQQLEKANETLSNKLHMRDTKLSIMTKENQELWKKVIALEEYVKRLKMEIDALRGRSDPFEILY